MLPFGRNSYGVSSFAFRAEFVSPRLLGSTGLLLPFHSDIFASRAEFVRPRLLGSSGLLLPSHLDILQDFQIGFPVHLYRQHVELFVFPVMVWTLMAMVMRMLMIQMLMLMHIRFLFFGSPFPILRCRRMF